MTHAARKLRLAERRRERLPRLSAEIDSVYGAALRGEAELDRWAEEARGACCPSCFHGAPYTALIEAQQRRVLWLACLLERRGEPRDLERAAWYRTCRGSLS